MTNSAHVTAWIQEIKRARKNADDAMHPWDELNRSRDKVPTKNDVEKALKQLQLVQAMADKIYSDLSDVEKALQGFGGPGDTWFLSELEMVKSLKRAAR